MVTLILHCPLCGSEALVRVGHAPNSKQKYRCHGCGRRSRENPTPNAYPEARRELTSATDANGNQVEYNGHPLYTFSGDTAPGQTTGNGTAGVWFVTAPDLKSQGTPQATPTTSGYGGY